MKGSGKTNRNYSRLSKVSSLKGLGIKVRCKFVDGIVVCSKYFSVLPHHQGHKRDYCFKHREKLAEIEAEQLIKKWENKTL